MTDHPWRLSYAENGEIAHNCHVENVVGRLPVVSARHRRYVNTMSHPRPRRLPSGFLSEAENEPSQHRPSRQGQLRDGVPPARCFSTQVTDERRRCVINQT